MTGMDCRNANSNFTVRSPNTVLLGLGANIPGRWGEPAEALSRAVDALEKQGIAVLGVSSVRVTAPIGPKWQPNFANAAVLVRADRGVLSLLLLLKRLERAAGRRQSSRWGPRPLDIDILDFGGRIVNWPAPDPRRRPGLVLPHPELHRRDFALLPLSELAPRWRHPVFGITARQLLTLSRRNRPA